MSKKQEACIEKALAELNDSDRKTRQAAAHTLAEEAKRDPEIFVEHAAVLIKALKHPEAQTRWEVLNALAEIACIDATKVKGAYDEAEIALFDERSSSAHLAAFRYFVRFAASSKARSKSTWDLIDEAIQCYHGDITYREMLLCLVDFMHGKIDADIAQQLVDRVAFDAQSGHGYMKQYSCEILALGEKEFKVKPRPRVEKDDSHDEDAQDE